MSDTCVTVTRIPDQGMISLRASMADAAVLGEVPTPNTVQGHMIWMSPDELMILCAGADRGETLRGIQQTMGDAHYLAVDVSDARVMFALDGPAMKEVLSKLTPTDVMGLNPGDFRRTRLGQVAGAFWLTSPTTAHVICFRSVADYMDMLLRDAAKQGAQVF